jgi:hypothetical protein
MALDACPGHTPVDKGTVAWDGENVNLGGGDYVPTQGFARGFYVGSGGVGMNVVVLTMGGSVVTFYNVQTGSLIPQSFQKIFQAGTTASQIVAMA